MDNNWRNCNLENVEYEECVSCSQNKTNIIRQTSWVITCKLDSLGKMPPAVSEGNYYWLGDYEQCSVLRKTNAFDGRYCRIVLEIPDIKTYRNCPPSDALKIHLGLCAPSMCTSYEITQLAQMITPYATNAECETSLDWPLSSQIFLFLKYCCSGYDHFQYYIRFLAMFLVIGNCSMHIYSRNGNMALSTKRSHKYHSVQGLEVITVSIIVAANCFIYILPYIENVLFSYESVYSWQLHPLNNFTYHIDGLIAIDTLLTSLLIRNVLETTNDIKKLYFIRLLQILPVFAFIIFFMTFLYERLSSGPIWLHDDLIARCKNSCIGNSTPQIFLAAYSAFHRPLWAFIICSLVYLGYRKHTIGGLLRFLEWRVFSPFARNIFVVFLISEPVSLYLFSSLHRPLHATVWSLVS
ncbi:Nose resistant to fluoxetine protein 6 [Dirofilaria immitis]|nr:Nose resistant to fluoxetine protein 6 [Dirofilaria immitis]